MKRLLLLLAPVAVFVVGAYFLLRPPSPEPARTATEPAPESASEPERPAAQTPVPPVPVERAREPVPPYPFEPPAWKRTMRRTYAGARVSLAVREMPLVEAAAELTRQLPWPVDVRDLPEHARSRLVTARYEDRPAEVVVTALASLVRARPHLRPGRIQLLPEGVEPEWTPAELPQAGLRRARRILDAGGPLHPRLDSFLPVHFPNVTLESALRQVGDRLRIAVEFDPRLPRNTRARRVSLERERMTAAEVLSDLTAAVRLSWAAEERRILVTDSREAERIRAERRAARALAEAPVSVAFADEPLHRVIREIGSQVNAPVVVDRELWGPPHPRITFRRGPVPLHRLLHDLAPKIPARVLIRGEAVYLVPPLPR